MPVTLQKMSLQEYAALERRLGAEVVENNGQIWRRVRPYFYRPILPAEPLRAGSKPPTGWPSACQYVVENGVGANSWMNFIIFDELRSYSLATVGAKHRNLIKRAASQFRISPVTDANCLKEDGHRVYLSFQERTKYDYRSDRRDKAVFAKWVDTLLAQPKTILLGGYGPNGLVGVSCAYWVNTTLIHATLFCETQAMRQNVGELLFHELRLHAAGEPGIHEIFARPYQGGNSHDQYYLTRGGHLKSRPARLEMPYLARLALRNLAPQKYMQLVGRTPVSESTAPAACSPAYSSVRNPLPSSRQTTG